MSRTTTFEQRNEKSQVLCFHESACIKSTRTSLVKYEQSERYTIGRRNGIVVNQLPFHCSSVVVCEANTSFMIWKCCTPNAYLIEATTGETPTDVLVFPIVKVIVWSPRISLFSEDVQAANFTPCSCKMWYFAFVHWIFLLNNITGDQENSEREIVKKSESGFDKVLFHSQAV